MSERSSGACRRLGRHRSTTSPGCSGDQFAEREVEEAPLTDYNKPIPNPDPFVSKPYWDGGKEGKLMLPRCTTCNKVHFYPRTICP
ncbi:MAG TPA: zinc ribbon domain-containing protein, partial [Dehalococcoidia bacterium]|nr:zinc ribbon domain-containing protein [Dehalococcoidia bacterium]